MWFHEIDPYRCEILRKNFPRATVLEGDIRALSPDDVPGGQAHFFAGIGGFGLACKWAGFTEPIWTGGFPCQDVSCAGRSAGLDGEQSGLWFEWLRLIRARRPLRLLVENVPALRTRGYDRIHDALEKIGYTVRPIVVGADFAGAKQKRDRVWIVACAVQTGREKFERLPTETGTSRRESVVMDADAMVRVGDRRTEPDMVRMVHGFPGRVDRVAALGDSIIPQLPAAILRAWMKAEDRGSGVQGLESCRVEGL